MKKDYAKAQEMLTVFEEHNIQPRGRTLRYLANVLQTAGLPVTFSVPEATEGKDDGSQVRNLIDSCVNSHERFD